MSAQFNDEPTLRDLLDRKGWVKKFGENMCNCQPPYVFTVHGDWGAGKTSFLHQLHHYLTGETLCNDSVQGKPADEWGVNRGKAPPVVVWFEAWRFQHEKAPIISLLRLMRAQLAWHIKAYKESHKLVEVTALSLLGFMDKLTRSVSKELGAEADPGFSSIKKIGEEWEAEHFDVISPSESLRKHFEQVIKEICGDKGRIFVLIDDLDRCQPQAAYQLLEGIKIYLNLPNCVFVLAIDHRQLERAIAQCLPGAPKKEEALRSDDAIHQAREYLEKICQDVWHLPLVPAPKQDSLLRRCLGVEEAGTNTELDNVLQVLTEYGCLPANARKLKAYANTLRRFNELCPKKEEQNAKRHAQMVVVMSCLYHFHPQIYRLLELNPAFYNEMLLWAQGQKSSHLVFEGIKLVGEAASENMVKTPDPATGDFFRIGRLVCEAKDVRETEVKSYLLPHALT